MRVPFVVSNLSILCAGRIKTRFRRIMFIGEPKTFQDILSYVNAIDGFGLKSKERLTALEEFCIYGNSSAENKEKLRTLNAAKHAAKSLASTDHSVVIRALVLSAMLCQGSERSSEIFIENGGL